MKIWKIALVMVLAIGLVLGIASPALAAPPWALKAQADTPPPRIIRGEVVSSDDDTAFVVLSGWEEVEVAVNDETEYFKASAPPGVLSLARPGSGGLGLRQRLHRLVEEALEGIPYLIRNRLEMRLEAGERLGMGCFRPFGEVVNFDAIKVGSWVVVWAEPEADNLVAKRVVIFEALAYHQVSGTVADIDIVARTITVEPADDGANVILSYDDDTRFYLVGAISLGEGDEVWVVYDEHNVAQVVMVLSSLD